MATAPTSTISPRMAIWTAVSDRFVERARSKVVFDLTGKQVGITLRDALEAAGLKWYDETANPTSGLTQEQRLRSFSTMKSADGKGEFVYRVRGREIKLGSPKEWMVVTPHGIDPFAKLDSRILYPGSSVTLQFLQAEDKDRLPALSESTYGCSDSPFDANRGRQGRRP